MEANLEAKPTVERRDERKKLTGLSLLALGVVYGDIGTSPLYALRECFGHESGVAPTPDNVLGVLSLVFWALMLVVSVKYLGFVLRADNHGEGGVLALSALIQGRKGPRRGLMLGLGLFGSGLMYGDGMITPAISVLSAVEGLSKLHSGLESWILPATLAILLSLFSIQSKGTGRIGSVFGPLMLAWFLTIGLLGLSWIVREPHVCAAVLPSHAIAFLRDNGHVGFLVLGAVFLVVTGAEALYADMGHFGLGPIRRAWWLVVLPGLLLNYFGQGALLLTRPEAVSSPFYSLAPGWMLFPLIVLAATASIIASQAVISGAFSLTSQAIQLGYCPRMRIVHTSATEVGQIYVPQVNVILMLGTAALVLGFRSSSALAAAYGVAVTATMLITTLLFLVVAETRFGWHRVPLAFLVGAFLCIDGVFFGANVTKIRHGAWFPLLIGAAAFAIMTTWRKGRLLLAEKLRDRLPRADDFFRMTLDAPRVHGRAVFLTSDPDIVPSSILHNLKHNRILHEETALLSVVSENVPRVPRAEKVHVSEIGPGFRRITAHYGFLETPNIPGALALAREQGLDFPPEHTSFFLSSARLIPNPKPGMSRWRQRLFAFLYRNSLGATTYFDIPPSQVVEIGTQVRL